MIIFTQPTFFSKIITKTVNQIIIFVSCCTHRYFDLRGIGLNFCALYQFLEAWEQMEKKEISQLVINRLKKERKDWRSDHPFGFAAKPIENKGDGTTNMLKWSCQIPGPKGSPWQQGVYSLTMDFSQDFPVRPPKCVFKPVLPHPNIYPSGTVCLSILNDEQDWKPHITIKQILLGIQKLLKDEPNIESPAQVEPLNIYKSNREQYHRRVKAFAHLHRKID